MKPDAMIDMENYEALKRNRLLGVRIPPKRGKFQIIFDFYVKRKIIIKAIYSLSNEQIIEQYSSLQIYQVLVSVKINK